VVKQFADIDFSNLQPIEMGYVFEDLIRRFTEQTNATAGDHFARREETIYESSLLLNWKRRCWNNERK